jgi:predicted DNA-binding transcriptional regulator AlpA
MEFTVPEKYLKTKEAAEHIGMSYRWLEVARTRGDGSGPRYIKLKRTVRYRPSDLDSFMASHVRGPDKPARKARAQP